jgi:sRNA-binding carbon storage regulator CsrA
MMMLTGIDDESTIFVLEDGSELEITIIELEGNKSKVVISSDEKVSVIHKLLANSA